MFPNNTKVTREIADMCKKLSDAGINDKQIAEIYKISHATVFKLNRNGFDLEKYRQEMRDNTKKYRKVTPTKAEIIKEDVIEEHKHEVSPDTLQRIAKSLENLVTLQMTYMDFVHRYESTYMVDKKSFGWGFHK